MTGSWHFRAKTKSTKQHLAISLLCIGYILLFLSNLSITRTRSYLCLLKALLPISIIYTEYGFIRNGVIFDGSLVEAVQGIALSSGNSVCVLPKFHRISSYYSSGQVQTCLRHVELYQIVS